MQTVSLTTAITKLQRETKIMFLNTLKNTFSVDVLKESIFQFSSQHDIASSVMLLICECQICQSITNKVVVAEMTSYGQSYMYMILQCAIYLHFFNFYYD
jgi:hypothetical protein